MAKIKKVKKLKVREEDLPTKKKKKVKAEDDAPVKKKKKKAIAVSGEDAVFEELYGDDDEPKPKKKKKKVKAEDDAPVKKKKKKVRPVEDDEDEPAPKKFDREKELKRLKKSKGKLKDAQSLLADIQANSKKLSRTDTKGLVSIVGESAESIHQSIETDDVDAAAMLIRKRMLQAMVDVIPFIEDNIRSSNGRTGSYHLKSLYECIHSILGEMQALKDRDAIARNFIADVLQPYAAQIANALIQELNNIMTDLRPLVRDDAKQELNQTLNAARIRMGGNLNGQYTELRNGTLQFLQNNV